MALWRAVIGANWGDLGKAVLPGWQEGPEAISGARYHHSVGIWLREAFGVTFWGDDSGVVPAR